MHTDINIEAYHKQLVLSTFFTIPIKFILLLYHKNIGYNPTRSPAQGFRQKRRAEIYLQLYKCKSFFAHEHIDKKKPHKKYTMFQIRRAAAPLLTA